MNTLDEQYISILKDILENGYEDKNRTEVDTIFVLDRTIRHKMSEGFPLLTTKRVPYNIVKQELFWFISGSTDIRDLWKRGVRIWDGDWYKNYSQNTSEPYSLKEMKEFAEKGDTSFHESIWDLGPIYGHQWRKWGEDKSNGIKGIDQLDNVIEKLRTNPTSRRLLVNAWNPTDLPKMTLPPCHYGFELHTRPLSMTERLELLSEKTKISLRLDTSQIESVLKQHFIPERGLTLIWNQRSADFPLGVPFNLANYGTLLLMIADEVRMVPDELIGRFSNCHIYNNQIEGVKEQIEREPKRLPTLHVRDGMYSAGDGDIILDNYNPHPTIKFPLTN